MHDLLCDSNPRNACKQRSGPSGKFSTSLGLVSTKFGSAVMRAWLGRAAESREPVSAPRACENVVRCIGPAAIVWLHGPGSEVFSIGRQSGLNVDQAMLRSLNPDEAWSTWGSHDSSRARIMPHDLCIH
jgi:hypothetical protein